MQPLFYTSGKKIPLTQISRILGPRYQPAESDRSHFRDIYYDTFDLSIFKKDFILIERSGHLLLFSTQKSGNIERQGTGGKEVPSFWWDFPETPLKAVLKPIINLRALGRLCITTGENIRFFIQNREGKNVAKITIQNRHVELPSGKRKNLPSVIALTQVKGFAHAFTVIDTVLREHFQHVSMAKTYQNILQAGGYIDRINRAEYPPKLEPTWSVCHTLKTVSHHLLKELEVHRQGIIDDVDTEFLHDFRVAIRRFRAVIGQLKKAFLPETFKELRNGIKSIGSRTGTLRDLDVLMLEESFYKSLVPPRLQKGLRIFFSYILAQRKTEQILLAGYLRSEEYARTIKDIKSISSAPDKTICKENPESTIQTAVHTIEKQFGSIRKKIELFSHHKEIIHEIRIGCKKIRYLAELFSQLFSGKAMKPAIKELKGFQTHLGNLHDLHVQQEMLIHAAHAMEESEYKSSEAAVAVGGLITVLAGKEQLLSIEAEAALEKYRKKIDKKKIRQLLI